MKWYDDSASNIKIEKIPYRLLKVNDQVFDSIFQRDGEYYLSIKCGVAIYYKDHGYENFITDGFKMIYELPNDQQKEIKIDLNNIKNFLQENKTIISTIPGSDISLNADINTEYIAHRELDKSLLIKYDNYSLKDFPMEKRNYDEKIVIERLLNETDTTIGYEKEGKYYIDITESRECLEIINDGKIKENLKRNGNSIELPFNLGSEEVWETIEGKDIKVNNAPEGSKLKLIEIFGDTWKDPNNYSVQSIGELYLNDEGNPILDSEGNKQYKIEIQTSNTLNLLNEASYISNKLPNDSSNNLIYNQYDGFYNDLIEIKKNKTFSYTFNYKDNSWISVWSFDKNGKVIRREINNGLHAPGTKHTVTFTDNEAYFTIKVMSQPVQDGLTVQVNEGNYLFPYSEYKPRNNYITTILLSCQLMKIGNSIDKLYWDDNAGKYCVHQLNKKFVYHNYQNIWMNFSINDNQVCIAINGTDFINATNNQITLNGVSVISGVNSSTGSNTGAHVYIYIDRIILQKKGYEFSYEGARKYLIENDISLYLPLNNPQIIETEILEQETLHCYNNITYLSMVNSNLSPFIKAYIPIDLNNTDKILLPRKNNFESIIHATIEPKKTTNITFFEGGLDLKLEQGIELLDNGSEFISKQPSNYASNDYIDLIAYNPSTFTIDTIDLSVNNLYIYYYKEDKTFLKRDLINFNNSFHKSNILYPVSTKYCKVAFSLDTNTNDYYKVRILRDRTKEKGFQPLTKLFTNDNTYLKSFSSVILINNEVERLMVVSNDYKSLDEFAIVNNLNKYQKKHSYEIPKLLKPGEILSYTQSGKKQFAYKYNSTLYNSIVNVNYTRPYNEYHNIANNIRFTLFKELGNNNGSLNNTNNPYCATEPYIDIFKYTGNRITLSVASLMTSSKICFYREDKSFISQHTNANNFVTAIIPSNAYYMRGECYLRTLGGESADNKELIQKHVMVTLTNNRCDFIPYGINYPYTLVPDDSLLPRQYRLDLSKDYKYLFVEPYNFKYIIKDLNNVSETSYNNDDKWKLELFTKGNLPATLGYATLDDIKRKPFSTTTINTPSWSRTDVTNTLLVYTKYIKASKAFTLSTQMSIDDQGTIYLNDKEIYRKAYGTHNINLNLKEGYNKLVILIVNDGGNGGLSITPNITSTLNNIETTSSDADFNTTTIESNFKTEDIFFHNIINGKLLQPQENLNLRLDTNTDDKFIFSKDFVFSPDKSINGYISANTVELEENSRIYITRVYGGETNLTLLTVGGNICEIYFLNDYLIEDNSYYILHEKYTSGNQKIQINKIPENARYIAIVTDKENTGTKCANAFLFPGELERRIDTTSEYFETFNNFNKKIATLPYSSEILILKNKLPDLSKLVLDVEKYTYDTTNNRFIFPIKLDKTFSNYFLQYWNERPINFLNIFVDSTIDMNSSTKQYLINHTMNNVSIKSIEISQDILSNLVENTLYLSVSIENSNRVTVHDFLINGTYKLQLEKDSFTEIYEPYTEIINHHPMYLTASGLTLESSSSYYGIRKLEPPKNIISTSDNGLTTISWNEVVGATSYILYLDGKALETVTVPFYETMAEIKGMLSIKAKNSVTESVLSEEIFIHSVPTNPYIIYIDNNYNDKKYNFRVYFRDNSDIETGYRVRYQIDNRQEVKIDLPAAPGTGNIVETNFSAVTILEKVIVRITSLNEKGENELASQFILKLPPKFVWTYNEESKKIVLAWDNVFPECPEYAIRYKKKNDETATTIRIPNTYEPNSRIRYSIDLNPDDEMDLSLTGLKEEIYYIFTKPIKISKDLDVTKTPPDNFRSKKITNDTVEYSWMDNSTVETGWELSYVVNNGSPKTVTIPTTTKDNINKTYKYKYTFNEHGFIVAKLRMVWELNSSKYTEEITDYYFPVDNRPPSGLKKRYISRTDLLIEWDSQAYVDSYDISINKNGKEEIINTKRNSYNITLNDKVLDNYVVKVRTNFLGDQHSDFTDPLIFKPTWSDNATLNVMCTVCKESYDNNVKIIKKSEDIFELATRCTNKVSWEFPVSTVSLTRFQMTEGLISTETWNTGQKLDYSNTMILKTEDMIMQEAKINVINYQVTEYKGEVEQFIYSPSTISGKILMEINKTRIVCIGDSITAGHPGFWAESMTGEITHQYPYWLDRRLKFQYEVINKGYGSDRTYNVLNRFQKDVLDLSPQYCLIQIGTNDIYWGAASADGSNETFEKTTLADMKSNVMTMVDLCFKNNIVPIIGMLIPRTQVVTDPVVKFGLYAFNEWIVEYANTTDGLNYVDFFNAGKDKVPATPLEDPSSPGAMNPIYDGDNVYDEQGNLVKYGAGIHLNATGYKIMAEAIPLNLFTTIESGVKMYMDEKCTVEAEFNIEDKQNPFYEIEIDGMKLTRTKKIVRYIKNIGNSQVLFTIYPNDLHNLDYNFKFKETDEGVKTIAGILTPGGSIAIRMELTPLTEDAKSSIELSLVSREFSIES